MRFIGLGQLSDLRRKALLYTPNLLGSPLLKPNSRKKGTLIIKGLLGNLA